MTQKRTYKIQPPDVWDLIRADYAQGSSAPWLARRYDVSAAAIYKRARLGGWTKRALAETGFTPAPLGEPRDAALSAAHLATYACRHALIRGNVVQAQVMARLAGNLTRLYKAMPYLHRVLTPEQQAERDALGAMLRGLFKF